MWSEYFSIHCTTDVTICLRKVVWLASISSQMHLSNCKSKMFRKLVLLVPLWQCYVKPSWRLIPLYYYTNSGISVKVQAKNLYIPPLLDLVLREYFSSGIKKSVSRTKLYPDSDVKCSAKCSLIAKSWLNQQDRDFFQAVLKKLIQHLDEYRNTFDNYMEKWSASILLITPCIFCILQINIFYRFINIFRYILIHKNVNIK